jgi:hypothetical protein
MRILLFVTLFSFTTKLFAAPAFPTSISCFGKVTAFLDKLGTVEKWMPYPGGVGGSISELGTVELYQNPKSTLLLTKTALTVTRMKWDEPKCEEQVSSTQKRVVGFSDINLSEVLLKNPNGGFIYIWSPHMALSVAEVATLEGLKLKYHFTVILDPKADMALAKSVAEKNKLPESYLLPLDSLVLQAADITIHYPSIVFYKNGKILKRIPGQTGSGLPALINENLK